MMQAICRRLRELDPRLLPSPPEAGVAVGIDKDPMAKVTILLFDAAGSLVAVAKVARDPRVEPALEAEHDALSGLAAAPRSGPFAQVPVPLLLERVGPRLTLVVSAVAGAPMTLGYYTPGHVTDEAVVTRDFARAGEWLAAWQRATSADPLPFADAVRDHVGRIATRYRTRVAWSDWEADVFADIETAATAGDLAVPLPVVHGDYAIGNVLVRGDAVSGVVDWELSRRAGLPMTDVLKFAASYSSFLDRAQPPRRNRMRGHPGWSRATLRWPASPEWSNFTGFMYGFFGEGWYAELVRRFVTGHARRLGLPDEAVGVSLLAFIAEQATVLDNPTYARGYRSLLRAVREQWPDGRLRVAEAR
jgi:aminoglycoside phosphotransferase (APT) family kinase protein